MKKPIAIFNLVILFTCAAIYAGTFIYLTSLSVYLSVGLSLIIMFIQSEYKILEKIQIIIIDLIIKIYGE